MQSKLIKSLDSAISCSKILMYIFIDSLHCIIWSFYHTILLIDVIQKRQADAKTKRHGKKQQTSSSHEQDVGPSNPSVSCVVFI